MPKSPEFWQDRGWLSHLLYPLTWVWQAAGFMRRLLVKSPSVLDMPVICVGNVTVGGVGKTPMVMALAEYYQQHHKKVHLVCKSYGGTQKKPIHVKHQPFTVTGDEAQLLKTIAPTWCGADRVETLHAAAHDKPDIIIMDDGLQHPKIMPHHMVLVIDGVVGLGNNRVIPAGPLREPLEHAMKRVQTVVIIGQDRFNLATMIHLKYGKTVLKANIALDVPLVIANKRVVAFAGIGRPQKFFDSLREAGIELAAVQAFPDHHPYTERNRIDLMHLARQQAAPLVTTFKDYMRLEGSLKEHTIPIPMRLVWQDMDVFHQVFRHG
jgi:tetraacyldisaccharide 4'-kinase